MLQPPRPAAGERPPKPRGHPTFERFGPRFQEVKTGGHKDENLSSSYRRRFGARGRANFVCAAIAEAPNARTPAAITVSDAELETLRVHLRRLARLPPPSSSAEMKTAQTEEQALAIRGKVETESIAKVEQHGWTPEKFNSISEAISNDPGIDREGREAHRSKVARAARTFLRCRSRRRRARRARRR